MPVILWIIFFSLSGSFLSMAGGYVLLWREQLARRLSLFLISFAAGVLLSVAFFDLLPEALEGAGGVEMFALIAVLAIAVSFGMERSLWWFHHHRIHSVEHVGQKEHPEQEGAASKVYLLLVGDAVHNFVDGVLIAAAFLADFNLGIGVSVGVIAHELPQEIADFSVMLHAGFSKAKTLLLNFVAASTTLLGAITAYFIAPAIEDFLYLIVSFAMGVFIYIALSDLIPEIHHQSEQKHNLIHFILLVVGISIGWMV